MPTTKQRITISVDRETEETLRLIAKRDKVPVASKACDLLRLALEIEEDAVLGEIMDRRDTKDAKYVSFDEVYKRLFPGVKR